MKTEAVDSETKVKLIKYALKMVKRDVKELHANTATGRPANVNVSGMERTDSQLGMRYERGKVNRRGQTT